MIGVRHPPTDSRRPARGWRGLRWPLRHKPTVARRSYPPRQPAHRPPGGGRRPRPSQGLRDDPGPQAHPAKLLFEKYFLWKARNGYVRLP